MKVGITGGGGFIGGYVAKELASRGYDPVIFDHYDRGGYDYPVMLGDVRDDVAMMELAAHTDGIIHLAACLGTQETILKPMPAAKTNIVGGLNFLEACDHHQIPGVNIGVGNFWMNNTYSISKHTVERFVDMYNRDRGTRVNIVRAMNAYGPGQRAVAPWGSGKVRKITPSFICRALAGLPVELYGDGSQVSDMVYVGDVAKALVIALEKAIDGEVFPKAVEIGPAEHTSVKELAEMVIKLCDSDSEIVCLPMRPGEIPNSTVCADTETLSMVGMSPDDLVPLWQGMAKTVKYFKNL